jgi:uncharacterized membrane protein YesL
MKKFKIDNPFFNLMDQIGDLVILNVLWLVCCLPVITIGASTMAMTDVTMKMAAGEAPAISRTFFRVFRDNFMQATIMFLALLVMGAILFLDFLISPEYSGFLGGMLLVGSVAFGVAWLWAALYVYLVMLTFKDKFKETLKKAVMISFIHFPYTLAISGIVLAPILIALWNPEFTVFVFPFFVIIGASAMSLGISFFTNKVMSKYKQEAPE